jgi:hypothetical protein
MSTLWHWLCDTPAFSDATNAEANFFHRSRMSRSPGGYLRGVPPKYGGSHLPADTYRPVAAGNYNNGRSPPRGPANDRRSSNGRRESRDASRPSSPRDTRIYPETKNIPETIHEHAKGRYSCVLLSFVLSAAPIELIQKKYN